MYAHSSKIISHKGKRIRLLHLVRGRQSDISVRLKKSYTACYLLIINSLARKVTLNRKIIKLRAVRLKPIRFVAT